jgi:hypothetical protein
MKQQSRNFNAFVIFSIISLLTFVHKVNAQTLSGTIEGYVFNSINGQYLSNARVTIDGTKYETLTDQTGYFSFRGVQVGEVSVSVNFVGMKSVTEKILVTDGAPVSRQFGLELLINNNKISKDDVVQLSAYRVTEAETMSAQSVAMNEQRNAPNIKNVVSIEEFGNIGDENIGNFLQFLPGASISYSGWDPIGVSLRGLPSNSTGVTVDGYDVPTVANGNSRGVYLMEVPMANASRVEITKVPTPDVPASYLGGYINIITRSGFETIKPKFDYNIYYEVHNRTKLNFNTLPPSIAGLTTPSFIQPSFTFKDLLPFSRKFSITFGGSRTFRFKPSETGSTQDDESTTWDLVRNVQTTSQMNSLQQVWKTLQGQIGLEWRPNPNNLLTANFQYRYYDIATTRSVLAFNYGAGSLGDNTFSQTITPTGTSLPVGSINLNSGANAYSAYQNKMYALRYAYNKNNWKFDVSGAYTTSQGDTKDTDQGFFNTVTDTISNVIIRGSSFNGVIPTQFSVTNASGAAVNYTDGGNYSIVSATHSRGDTGTQRYGTRINLAHDFNSIVPITLKAGYLSDVLQSDQKTFSQTFTFTPNGMSDATSRLASNYNVFDSNYNDSGPTLYGKPVKWTSASKVYQLYQQNPSWFVENKATTWTNWVNNNRQLGEFINAAYLRVDARLINKKLWLVGGVRFEGTNDKGAGPLNQIANTYKRNPDGSFVLSSTGARIPISTDALTNAQLQYVYLGTTENTKYHGYYPSFNASYNFTEKLIIRAGYALTLGRPNLNYIIPGTSITDSTVAVPTITVNNTALKPWTAKNYDLALESYQFKDTFLSVGAFEKDIQNFFNSVSTLANPALLSQYGLQGDPTLLNYTITTYANGGDAKVTGYEASYRQNLTFLPHWAQGLQVFVNATKIHLSSSNHTADFSGYTPKSASAGISLNRKRYSARATVSYTGDLNTGAQAASATVPLNTYNYQLARTRYALSLQYVISKHFSIYYSTMDIGGFLQTTQRYAPTTPTFAKDTRRQALGYYNNFGVRGSF